MHNLCFVIIIFLCYLCFLIVTAKTGNTTSFFINQTLDQLENLLSTTTTTTRKTSTTSINLKYKCAKYIISMNIKPGNLVMILQNNQQHKKHEQEETYKNLSISMIDHNFISYIMQSTNVILVNHNEWPMSDTNKKFNKNHFSFVPHTFLHGLGIVSFYIIESTIHTLKKKLMSLQITNTNNQYQYHHHHYIMEFNTRGMYILFLDTKNILNNDVNENLLRAFNIFWHYNIYNTLIMVCNNTITTTRTTNRNNDENQLSNGSCNVYTWYPYDSLSNCGRNLSNYEKIFECNYNTSDNHCIWINYTKDYKKLFARGIYSNVQDDEMWSVCSRMYNNNNELNRNNMESNYGDDGNDRKTNNNSNNVKRNFNKQKRTTLPIPFSMTSSSSLSSLPSSLSSSSSLPSPPFILWGRRQKIHLHKENRYDFFEDCKQKNDNGQQHDDEKNWDKKYVKEFFSYNYRPYGTIEFRQNVNKNVNANKDINDNIKVSAQLHHHIENKRKFITNTASHFFDKIPTNMNKCRFSCLLFVWPPFVTPPHIKWYGLEHKLLLDISRYMNFQLNETYQSVSFNMHDGNDKSFELLNILSNSSIDMAFGNVYPNIDMHQYFDYSIGYLYDHVNWVVPLAKDQPMLLNLVRCFR